MRNQERCRLASHMAGSVRGHRIQMCNELDLRHGVPQYLRCRREWSPNIPIEWHELSVGGESARHVELAVFRDCHEVKPTFAAAGRAELHDAPRDLVVRVPALAPTSGGIDEQEGIHQFAVAL